MPICLACEKTVGVFELKDGVCKRCLGNESNSNDVNRSTGISNNLNNEIPPSSMILYILSFIFLIVTFVIADQFLPGESLREQNTPVGLYIPFILSLLCGVFLAGVLFSLGKALSLLNKIATK